MYRNFLVQICRVTFVLVTKNTCDIKDMSIEIDWGREKAIF
jgi:hypothetical protein